MACIPKKQDVHGLPHNNYSVQNICIKLNIFFTSLVSYSALKKLSEYKSRL